MKPLYNIVFFISVTLLIIIISPFILHQAYANSKTILTVTVLPARIIFIDNYNIIQKVFSNTDKDIPPEMVVLGQENKILPPPKSIIEQYNLLKPDLDFSKAGIIYQRDNMKEISKIVMNNINKIKDIFNKQILVKVFAAKI